MKLIQTSLYFTCLVYFVFSGCSSDRELVDNRENVSEERKETAHQLNPSGDQCTNPAGEDGEYRTGPCPNGVPGEITSRCNAEADAWIITGDTCEWPAPRCTNPEGDDGEYRMSPCPDGVPGEITSRCNAEADAWIITGDTCEWPAPRCTNPEGDDGEYRTGPCPDGVPGEITSRCNAEADAWIITGDSCQWEHSP